ncbi:MAG: tetratricopeptide repeat protein [Gammaproteobacteria bacterium]|nr:tetratricopeptide repeat protein [Gammaproteobacteria bacterium]
MYKISQIVPVSIVLGVCFCATPQALSEPNQQEPLVTTPTPTLINAEEILALNSRMRSMVDLFVKPVSNRERRAQEVYKLMFDKDKFALYYDNSYTKTAIETIESGSGNCVSLASVFVAMARYAGLEANYLDVEVPDNWQRESDVLYQLKHISASAKVAARTYLGIEYEWLGSIGTVKPRTLSDEQAFGTYYANRGIELLMQDNMDAAMLHLNRAIELDPENSNNWSNLGVAFRRLNKLDAAEHAYLQALKKDKSDLTALNNLAILYQITGKSELADKYNAKLERYHRKNPYYLIRLAKKEIEAGDYSKALKFTKSAIRKYDEEHEFYFIAAKIYAHMGDTEKAMENLKNAEKYALSARNRDLYSRKLKLLSAQQKDKRN